LASPQPEALQVKITEAELKSNLSLWQAIQPFPFIFSRFAATCSLLSACPTLSFDCVIALGVVHLWNNRNIFDFSGLFLVLLGGIEIRN
jgi:hypothetical protein